MAAVEGNFNKLQLKESAQKGKGEMLSTPKNNKGKVHQSGEDSPDSVPSNKAALVPDLLKGMALIVPPLEDQPKKEEEEDVEMREPDDSTDAVPTNRPTARVAAVPQSGTHQQQAPCKHEASTRPGPSNAKVATVLPSGFLPQQPPFKQEAHTRPRSSAGAGPGARCEDGQEQGMEENTVEQAMNLEEEKDLILYETAEQVAGSCDIRKLAFRLRITESIVAQIEHDNPKLISQFYKVFQQFSSSMPNTEEMFRQLLEKLVKANQASTASWLRKRLGIREPKASVAESNPISDAIPQTEAGGGNSNHEFYDIFLMHSGKSNNTEKFQNICSCHNWVVKTSDTIPAADPVHDAIERILSTSTHLALIITENDCIKYKKHEMCLTVEMALQLAYTHGTLSGRVLPIRCCEKRSLPLVLQALTGAHIDEESFEERLVETINTSKRLSRMRENQE